MSEGNWEDFYSQNPPPKGYAEAVSKIEEFVAHHAQNNIVLVTSGGTTVPLEHNTVRFVDNFSAGTRGSASAEYFLKNDYIVIFLHRYKSLEPFSRHFTTELLLESLEISTKNNNQEIKVVEDKVSQLLPIVIEHQRYKGALLKVPFTTLSEYLHLLRAACIALAPLERRVLLYLAAAVSDFYVPSSQMATHKIQSVDGPLHLQLQLVPKVLQPLVCFWIPKAFVVSFKLETDSDLLIPKARAALQRYGHKVVIANELMTRKHRVFIVEGDQETLVQQAVESDHEIEETIVKILVNKHSKHLGNTS